MNIIVTGGAGFIGGNFMHYMVNNYPNDNIICVDCLTYAGNLETLDPIKDKKNYKFIKEDITNREGIYKIFEETKPDIVVNFAAESHVDRSVETPEIFIKCSLFFSFSLLKFKISMELGSSEI